jgi:hypothetical protein
MTEIGTLIITDDLGNELVQVACRDNKISANTVMVALMGRIYEMNFAIKQLQGFVGELQVEMADHKEAFEHTDDSLQNLRTTVSSLKVVQ